ncbi:MAG: hypothetical protein AAGF86_16185, partial [Pseudomonadota bacterium]
PVTMDVGMLDGRDAPKKEPSDPLDPVAATDQAMQSLTQAPEGVDPLDWAVLTDEERALWQQQN